MNWVLFIAFISITNGQDDIVETGCELATVDTSCKNFLLFAKRDSIVSSEEIAFCLPDIKICSTTCSSPNTNCAGLATAIGTGLTFECVTNSQNLPVCGPRSDTTTKTPDTTKKNDATTTKTASDTTATRSDTTKVTRTTPNTDTTKATDKSTTAVDDKTTKTPDTTKNSDATTTRTATKASDTTKVTRTTPNTDITTKTPDTTKATDKTTTSADDKTTKTADTTKVTRTTSNDDTTTKTGDTTKVTKTTRDYITTKTSDNTKVTRTTSNDDTTTKTADATKVTKTTRDYITTKTSDNTKVTRTTSNDDTTTKTPDTTKNTKVTKTTSNDDTTTKTADTTKLTKTTRDYTTTKTSDSTKATRTTPDTTTRTPDATSTRTSDDTTTKVTRTTAPCDDKPVLDWQDPCEPDPEVGCALIFDIDVTACVVTKTMTRAHLRNSIRKAMGAIISGLADNDVVCSEDEMYLLDIDVSGINNVVHASDLVSPQADNCPVVVDECGSEANDDPQFDVTISLALRCGDTSDDCKELQALAKRLYQFAQDGVLGIDFAKKFLSNTVDFDSVCDIGLGRVVVDDTITVTLKNEEGNIILLLDVDVYGNGAVARGYLVAVMAVMAVFAFLF